MTQRRIFLVKSIPLSKRTRKAWKAATPTPTFILQRPQQEMHAVLRHLSPGPNIVINLGNIHLTEGLASEDAIDRRFYWNLAEWVAPIRTPGAARKLFSDLLPPQPTEADLANPVWVKAPGKGGNGKTKTILEKLNPKLPATWDIQTHINGTEYRIVTVGSTRVQAYQRTGENGNRKYHWVGVQNCPKEIRKIAKIAASRLHPNTIVAWDTILTAENKAYLLEGNACPGVNEHTAQRIFNEVLLQVERVNSNEL